MPFNSIYIVVGDISTSSSNSSRCGNNNNNNKLNTKLNQ